MAAKKKSTYKEVLGKTRKQLKPRLNVALQMTALEAISRMIDRTPVKTGAAKYHWFVRPLPDEQFDKDRTDPSGQEPKQRASRDVKFFKIGQRIWFVNSAPYFIYLERGSSQQAPAGVVTITLAELGLLFKRSIKASFGQRLGR